MENGELVGHGWQGTTASKLLSTDLSTSEKFAECQLFCESQATDGCCEFRDQAKPWCLFKESGIPREQTTRTPGGSETYSVSCAQQDNTASTSSPSAAPSGSPSDSPTFAPSSEPSASPTLEPTSDPSLLPTTSPTVGAVGVCDTLSTNERYHLCGHMENGELVGHGWQGTTASKLLSTDLSTSEKFAECQLFCESQATDGCCEFRDQASPWCLFKESGIPREQTTRTPGAVSSVTKLVHGVYSRRVVFHESRQPEHPVVVRPTLSRASEKKKLQLWEVILSRVEDLVVVE